MTPIHNGPARNQPRGRQQQPPAVLRDPTICLCPHGRPIPIARFVAEALVGVELRHLRATGCGMPSTHVEPRVYQAGIRR